MAKAKIELKSGSIISIEGSADEINTIIKAIENQHSSISNPPASLIKRTKKETERKSNKSEIDELINNIVSSIHDSDEFESIERKILDKKDRTAKILLCFKFADDFHMPLTTSSVEKITSQLGIMIASANIAKVIRLGAKKYLTASSVRKQGAKIYYKINRAGLKKYYHIINGEK